MPFHAGNYLRFGLPSSLALRQRDPCCGLMALETGAKAIAIIQLIMSSILFGAFVFGFAVILAVKEQIVKDYDESMIEHWKQKSGLLGMLLGLLLGVVLSGMIVVLQRYLYKGVVERDLKKVSRWWNIFLVITVLSFIFCLLFFWISEKLGEMEFVKFFIDLYSLLVIREFKKTLENPVDHTVEFERVIV